MSEDKQGQQQGCPAFQSGVAWLGLRIFRVNHGRNRKIVGTMKVGSYE